MSHIDRRYASDEMQIAFTTEKQDWRRGDSNLIRGDTEPLHTPCNSGTNPNARPLESGFEKQNPDTSEHFQTLSQHELGAPVVRENDPDPDLALLVKAWPNLPESTRKQIIETARAALKSEGSKP